MSESSKKPRTVSSIPNVTSTGAMGGTGQTPAWCNPDIVMSAPAGIAMVTPQSASFNAGTTTSIAAGQDINLLAQANAAHSVKSGISLFTYGKASNPKKPNQEVGISLHAASGKVSSQSQSDKTQITADKAITVASTTDAVSIQAPKHVLLTAQGAYIKMSGGNIEVHAPGKVEFKASMKSWTSAKSDKPAELNFEKISLAPIKPKIYAARVSIANQAGEAVSNRQIKIVNQEGDSISKLQTGGNGKTTYHEQPEKEKLYAYVGGEGKGWEIHEFLEPLDSE
jgi:type VI secretion system secreted protein VgrG